MRWPHCSGWGEARSTSGTTGPSRAPSCARSQQRQRALPSSADSSWRSPTSTRRASSPTRPPTCCSGGKARSPSGTTPPGCRSRPARSRSAGCSRSPTSPSGRSRRRSRRIGASPTSSSAYTAATRSPSSSSAGTRSTSSARDRHAFVGYRIEGNVMLLSGDPVGEPASLPLVLRETCAFAERHGLRLGAVGVGACTSSPLPRRRLAGDVHRRRGDRRDGHVLTRGARDPKGAPVGLETGGGRLLDRGAGARAARPADPRRARRRLRTLARRRARAWLLDGNGLARRRSSAGQRRRCRA